MPRETNKQRREREEREAEEDRAQRLSDARNLWTTRLMKNLGHATQIGGEIMICGNLFNVHVPDSFGDPESYPISPVVRDLKDISDMEDLELALSMIELRLAEARRIEQVRVSALAKLTKEDREVLGI